MMTAWGFNRLAVIFLALLAISPSQARDIPAPVHILSLTPAPDGPVIPPDFFSLSLEAEVITAPRTEADRWRAAHAPLVQLLRSLGPSGILRVGGNSSEDGFRGRQWRPAPVTPQVAQDLAGLLGAAGWSLLWGLNAKGGDLERAVADARLIAAAIGPHRVEFQIGNEPLLQRGWPTAWPDMEGYHARWREWHRAIRAAIPEARFAGPDDVRPLELPGFLLAIGPSNLRSVTLHTYPLGSGEACTVLGEGACGFPQGAAGGCVVTAGAGRCVPGVTLTRLMAAPRAPQGPLARVPAQAAALGLPARLTEFNTSYAGGRAGVSDVLGAANWIAEFGLALAAQGWASAHPHTAPGFTPDFVSRAEPANRYTLFWQRQGRVEANAPLMGWIMAARMAGARLGAVQVEGPAPQGMVRAYGAQRPDGRAQLMAFNLSTDAPVTLRLRAGASRGNLDLVVMEGEGCDAPAVRLNGAMPDPVTAALVIPRRSLAPGSRVSLPPCGAALIEYAPAE